MLYVSCSCKNSVQAKVSESDFQPRFVFEIYSVYYIQNPFSNILKIPRNSVSAHHNYFAGKSIYFHQVEVYLYMFIKSQELIEISWL